MSRLWKWVDDKNISRDAKTGLFLIFNIILWSVIGFVAWTFVSMFALNTLDWALCFVGYPGFFVGYIGGFIFLCQQ